MYRRLYGMACATTSAGFSETRGGSVMPEKKTIQRARKDKRQGKSPSTQAGEFVREEIHHVREGKHGARSPKQAIAIGLSMARRAGVDLPPPKGGSEETRRHARSDIKKSRSKKKTSTKRSRATLKALKREPHKAAYRQALARQARVAARRRTKSERSASAKKAARTRKRR